MRYVRGHNGRGVDRSGFRKAQRYIEQDRGFTTPCWIWQLSTGTHGYGKLRIKGRDWLAHRWHYMQAKGEIPAGLQLDHLCGVRECVNPDHLEPTTAITNSRRGRHTKLTYAQAVDIYTRENVDMLEDLAVEFRISKETIRLIRLRGPDLARRGR